MATPAKPRVSGLPTPGRSTGIPTPGRSRASSRAGMLPPLRVDVESERAFDALRKSGATHHRDSDISVLSSTSSNYPSLSPQPARTPANGRRSVAGGPRPGSVASTSSALSSGPPRTPLSRPKTPVTKPRSSAPVRPKSRQSEIRSSSRMGSNDSFEVGDPVRIESLGYDGVLRYIGEIEGKDGTFAGVELGGGLVGKGKNDGSVGSIHYFTCPPKCGVFVALAKLSRAPQRPVSVVSSIHSGRETPALNGRETPIYTTPSAKPRLSRQLSNPPITPQFTAGSIASKYAGITADRLRNATNTFTNHTPHKLASPTQSSPIRSSPVRFSRASPTRTPKATSKLSASRSSDVLASPARIELTTPRPIVRSHTMASLNSPSVVGLSPSRITNDGIFEGELKRMQLDSASKEELESLRSRLAALEAQHSALAEEERSCRDELAAVTRILQDAQEQVASSQILGQQLKESQELLKTRETDLEALEKRLRAAEAALTAFEQEAAETKDNLSQQLSAKCKTLEQLEHASAKLQRESETERSLLSAQVDELRSAGQETIALYEDRLSAAEARRYELEDTIGTLQEKMNTLARPLSPATMARHASEAAQIDNESLREQAAHLQRRITTLEELLEDTRTSASSEESALRAKLEKQREQESISRKELESWKSRVDECKRSEGAYRTRVEELETALRENSTALEDARSDVEVLRSELEIHESRKQPVDAFSIEAESKLEEQASKIKELQQLLEHTETAKKQSENQLTAEFSHDHYFKELESSRIALENEKQELLDDVDILSEKVQLQQQLLEELQTTVNDQQEEIRSLRRAADTVSLNSSSGSTGDRDVRPSRHDISEKREEITGLKHIVQQLSQENAAIQAQFKIVESERDLLLSELEQLRQDARNADAAGKINRDDWTHGSRASAGTDTELAELKRKFAESDSRHARVVHDLKKEISELETLIESKIYHEDELERELERYKEKAARAAKKLSKLSSESGKDHPRASISSTDDRADVCEICEQPGHDIFTCPILKEEKVEDLNLSHDVSQLWCEDCETFGHLPIDCPHSTDVF